MTPERMTPEQLDALMRRAGYDRSSQPQPQPRPQAPQETQAVPGGREQPKTEYKPRAWYPHMRIYDLEELALPPRAQAVWRSAIKAFGYYHTPPDFLREPDAILLQQAWANCIKYLEGGWTNKPKKRGRKRKGEKE